MSDGFFSEEDTPENWKEEWKDMPGYPNENLAPWRSLKVNFENEADMQKFAELIGQKVTFQTRSIWFPKAEIGHAATKLFVGTK